MRNILIPLAALSLLAAGCSNDDAPTTPAVPTSKLHLDLRGLPNPGSGGTYTGWIVVNGTPQSAGNFAINASGVPTPSFLTVDSAKLESATAFMVSIEPAGGAPTGSSIILAGSFAGDSALLKVSDNASLQNTFAAASGKFVLATPTDGDGTNEKSGVWFMNISGSNPTVGLSIPKLPGGWVYEGWARINGKQVSTGRFVSGNTADGASPYSGSGAAPQFPGEDFLKSAPGGLTFPTDLTAGAQIAVSIEPEPDFSQEPFLSILGAGGTDHTPYTMNNLSTNLPSGMVKR